MGSNPSDSKESKVLNVTHNSVWNLLFKLSQSQSAVLTKPIAYFQ